MPNSRRLSPTEIPAHIEETGVVHMGIEPGAQYGWECEPCDASTGLSFGSAREAADSLQAHLDSDHTKELP